MPYANNWLERLRQIRRIQTKVTKMENNGGQPNSGEQTMTGRVVQAPPVIPAPVVPPTTKVQPTTTKVQMSDFTEYT